MNYYISSGGSCFCLTPSYYQDSGLPSKDTSIDDPFVFNAAKVPRKVLYPVFFFYFGKRILPNSGRKEW